MEKKSKQVGANYVQFPKIPNLNQASFNEQFRNLKLSKKFFLNVQEDYTQNNMEHQILQQMKKAKVVDKSSDQVQSQRSIKNSLIEKTKHTENYNESLSLPHYHNSQSFRSIQQDNTLNKSKILDQSILQCDYNIIDQSYQKKLSFDQSLMHRNNSSSDIDYLIKNHRHQDKNVQTKYKQIFDLIDDETFQKRFYHLQFLGDKIQNKLTVGQEDLAQQLQQFQENIIKYMNELIDKHKNQNKLLNQQKKNNQNLENKIQYLNSNIDDLKIELQCATDKNDQLRDEIMQLRKHNHIDYDKINTLKIQNIQMKQFCTMEEEQIKQMMKENNIAAMNDIKDKLQKTISDKKTMQTDLMQSIQKLLHKQELMQLEIKQAEKNNQFQLETINQQKQQIINYQNMVSQETHQQMKEIAMMQLNDFQSLYQRQQSLLEKTQEQTYKIKELSNQLRLFQNKIKPESFQEQKRIIFQVNKHLSESEFYFQLIQVQKSNNTELQEIEFQQENKILNKYQYQKPSYLQMIEDPAFKDYQNENENQYGDDIPINFLQTIRSILDAKYSEYLVFHDAKQYSRFPEFVFSWLNTFQFCKKTLKTQQVIEFDEVELIKFQLFLQNCNDKLWEIQTFKEFLEDKYSSDEIYFYLNCRFLLTNGPIMTDGQAIFNIIYYVNYIHVKNMIDSLFSHFDKNQIQQIHDLISKETKNKNNDLNFILRVFLDYYRKECQIRYNMIDLLFLNSSNAATKNNKKGFFYFMKGFTTFKQFYQFLDNNFPGLSFLEISGLFRDCHSVGKGFISSDIFITVCNEQNFFIQILKQRYIYQ